jgi:hypothetical protein
VAWRVTNQGTLMGTYKETTIAGKAAQRGIVEQREQPQRSKKDRPIIVEMRRREPLGKWGKWKAYINLRSAEQGIASKNHGFWSKNYEFRIRPENLT